MSKLPRVNGNRPGTGSAGRPGSSSYTGSTAMPASVVMTGFTKISYHMSMIGDSMRRDVRLDIAGGVAVVTIDRPEVRNAIGLDTIGQLRASLDEAAFDRSVRVLVLRGAGERVF